MERGLVTTDQSTIFGDGTPGKPLRSAGGVLSASVELNSAQLLNLGSVPVEMVPAPGAGKALVPLGAVYSYKAGSIAYDLSNAASPLIGVLTGPLYDLVAELTDNTGNEGIDTLHDSIALFFSQANTLSPASGVANLPINVQTIDGANSNAGFDLLAGDGTMRVTVYYAVSQV